jgi:hypothetical protein
MRQASWIITCGTRALPAFIAVALVWRSGQPDEAGQRPPVREVAYEQLAHQRRGRGRAHAGDHHQLPDLRQRLGSDAERLFVCSNGGDLGVARSLQGFDLLLDQVQPVEQSFELGARVRRQRFALCRPQVSKLLPGGGRVRIELHQPVQRE